MLINSLKTLHLQMLHYTMTVWLFFNSLIIMWNGNTYVDYQVLYSFALDDK